MFKQLSAWQVWLWWAGAGGWLRLLNLEEMTVNDFVFFFLGSCRIKWDLIQELGKGVTIVQVEGRGACDRQIERNRCEKSTAGTSPGHRAGRVSLGLMVTCENSFSLVQRNETQPAMNGAHTSCPLCDFRWEVSCFLQAYAFSELWEASHALKILIFLRLLQIVTILRPSFTFSNDSLFLLSLSPSSASSPPLPSLSGYVFWHLVCLPGKRQLREKGETPSLLLGCARILASEWNNGSCSLGKGNACHIPLFKQRGQVQGPMKDPEICEVISLRISYKFFGRLVMYLTFVLRSFWLWPLREKPCAPPFGTLTVGSNRVRMRCLILVLFVWYKNSIRVSYVQNSHWVHESFANQNKGICVNICPHPHLFEKFMIPRNLCYSLSSFSILWSPIVTILLDFHESVYMDEMEN